jgi:hypothetical protein
MRQIFALAISLCLSLATDANATSTSANLVITAIPAGGGGGDKEEFVGPFANWKNVKASPCNAAGNGTTDDTVAIQTCFNGISATSPVVYFPAGTYKVTNTLNLTGKSFLSVVGADPATTSLVWSGSGTPASLTGSLANDGITNTLTVTAVSSGTLVIGHKLVGSGLDGNAFITASLTGSGGPGTYKVSGPLVTVASEALTTQYNSALWINGMAYSRIDRLKLDGNNTVNVLVDQAYDGVTGDFDTGNEYADDAFQGALGIEFACGFLGFGCAETSVLRSSFSNAPYEALSMGGFNALNMWVWYSQFHNNAIGITNADRAGNFHAFNSIFLNSSTADAYIGNTGVFTFDNNYSTGAGRFLFCTNQSNPANISVEGNTILDTAQSSSILCGNSGPLVAIDNTIRSSASATSPVVSSGIDLFSGFNTYTISSPLSGARSHSIGDQFVSRASINPSPPTLPSTPPNNSRAIFEVVQGSSGATIQAAINNAVAAGTRAVVHLQAGVDSYNISSTLSVPANSTIQIIGDGQATHVFWSGAANGTLMRLIGPSQVVLRDMVLDGNSGAATCLEVTNADQAGASVFMEQPNLSRSTISNLFVDALDRTKVEIHNATGLSLAPTALNVVGGTQAAAGNWLGGATNIFGAAGFGNTNIFALSGNAHLNVKQFWNDAGGTSTRLAALSGTGGVFGVMGMAGYLSVTGSDAVGLNNFSGTSAIVNLSTNESALPGDEVVSGTGAGASNLSLGALGVSAMPFSDTTSPADTHGFLNGQTISGCSGSCTVTESGSLDQPFLTTALGPLRAAQPTLPTAPAGATDVRLYRLATQNCIYAVHLKH